MLSGLPTSPLSALLRSAAFLALVAAAFVTLSIALRTIGVSLHSQGAEEGPKTFLNTLALCAIALGATACLARFERRSMFAYGLVDRWGLCRWTLGLATGIVSFAVLVATLLAVRAIDFSLINKNALHAFGWGFFWLACYFGVAVAEEILFRGYLLSTLSSGLGSTAAILVTSLLFGLIHLSNGLESPIAAINGILFGAVLAWSVRRSGSLWWAIGLHAGWDWTESYLAGAADSGIRAMGRSVTAMPQGNVLWSGGAAGPEGSLAMVLAILLVGIACAITFGRVHDDESGHLPRA